MKRAFSELAAIWNYRAATSAFSIFVQNHPEPLTVRHPVEQLCKGGIQHTFYQN